ncbi:MAG: sulfotransferase [Alphaproteobacteria bacterium]|nr:sulfotransferase [Alphaproteobacteria bacterium]
MSQQPDTLTLAARRLAAERPLKHRRLLEAADLVAANRFGEAESALSEHLSKRGDDVDALALLARALVRQGRKREAIAVLERVAQLAPDFAVARFNLANLLAQTNRFDAALAELDAVLGLDPDNALFLQLKASILETTGESAASLAICRRLADENPNRAECFVSLGHALRALGRKDEAVAAYRNAIALVPQSGLAWWSLANMKTARFGSAEIDLMRRQLARGDLAVEDRLHLQFALGKAYEDAREFDKSFEQYAKANATTRLRIDYDPGTLGAGVAANKRIFTREFFASREGQGCPAPDPIFVLGRPRSGSTLIEQILSSHSAIEGTAELPYITAMAARLEGREGSSYSASYLDVLARLSADELKRLGEEFMDATRVHRKQGRPFFIDKKPGNFPHVGLIHLILPNAKIVDARRHPAACGLSMFKHYSSKGRLRLSELGLFYRDYVALMAHFDAVLPGRVHRVIYEEMVADPEREVRRLLGHLGLPFEESCLRFYETERTVLTPSSEQVRRPISGEAVDYWKNYEPHLQPLIRSLGSVFDEYPRVPAELR